ncbi:MAG: NADH-quinone oxidoreductase subunit C [Dehalococcoidia bacterium]|nr:NADH-quinone oxidoreductase subunit C [Dehalococcoidia bacterium]
MTQESASDTPVAELPPGTVYDLFREALPGVQMTAAQTGLDVAITVRREDLLQVMEAAKGDARLAFDFLRSLSGVDYLDELEVVYHLYSYRHDHSAAIKSRCPPDDAHVPTVSHLWQTANWHEREAAEMFGFVFDGHPDLRPLLTEEGLGYYILRKTHPLAEIEEWQEDYLKAAEEAVVQAAAEAGVPMDERARKIEMAQKKAVVIKKAREKARAEGLSADDEKAAVQAAIKAFDDEAAGAAEAVTAPATAAPAKPADDRAAKIALAQKKAAVIKRTREEARAKGLSPEEERLAVAEALKALSAGEKGG